MDPANIHQIGSPNVDKLPRLPEHKHIDTKSPEQQRKVSEVYEKRMSEKISQREKDIEGSPKEREYGIQSDFAYHDFMTAGSEEAYSHAWNIGTSLLAVMRDESEEAIQTGDKVVMDKVITEKQGKSTVETYKAIMDSFKNLLNNVDLNNPDDLKLLGDLSGLLKKCFSMEQGGIGSIEKGTGWDKNWDNISFSKGDLEKNKELLGKLIDHLKGAAENHFKVDSQHHLKVELNVLQVNALIGQLMTDFLLNPGMKSSDKLRKCLDDNQLINNFDKVKDFQTQIRTNPLLAETKTDSIRSEVLSKISDFISDKLKSMQPPLSETELKDLTKEVLEDLKKETVPRDVKSSIRGRTALVGTNRIDEFSKKLRGDIKKGDMFYVMPSAKMDAHAYKTGTLVLYHTARTPVGPGSNDLIFENELEEITKHAGEPRTVLRLGFSLESNLQKLINEPDKVLLKSLERIQKNGTQKIQSGISEDEKNNIEKKQDYLKNLKAEVEKDSDKLNQSIGQLDISYNDLDKSQKMPLGELAKLPSVAQIMYQNHLRTICSISGTTTDILVGIATQIGEENVKELVSPLLSHAKKLQEAKDKGEDTTNLQIENGARFKEIFSRATFFMQAGKYHSAAEVLGGLFIGSLTGENVSPQDTFQMFQALMEDFSNHPNKYLPLSKGEELAIFHPVTQNLVKARIKYQRLQEVEKNLNVEGRRANIGKKKIKAEKDLKNAEEIYGKFSMTFGHLLEAEYNKSRAKSDTDKKQFDEDIDRLRKSISSLEKEYQV